MISLRPIQLYEIDYFLHVLNDPETLYYMESDTAYEREDFYATINYPKVKWYVIMNTDVEQGIYRDPVGLFNTFIKDNKLFLGIIIDKPFRGKGYSRETFEFFLRECDKENLDTHLSCFTDNFAYKMYKKLGYKLTGESKIIRGRKHVWMKRKAKNS